jgi:hypothetical protein
MYGLIIGLAVFVAATYFLIDTGGGAHSAAAREISVVDLARGAPNFDGEDVITTGTLSYSEEHGAYQITDKGNYAIILRGYSDEALLASLKNKTVQVTGTFSYDTKSGVYIETSSVIEAVAQ